MISDHIFSSSFTAFWQALLPAADAYVRMLNVRSEAFLQPLESNSAPKRRAIINETAFRLYVKSINENLDIQDTSLADEAVNDAARQAWTHIRLFEDRSETLFEPLSKEEGIEALEIARRTVRCITHNGRGLSVTPQPLFPGCGFVSDCVGDLLVGLTLYEIKAGERSFRLIDMRQVLIYLALNYASKKHLIQRVAFFNPRVGTYYNNSVNGFVFGLSGRSYIDVFNEVIEFVSSGGISR